MASNYINISSFEEFNNALTTFETTISKIAEVLSAQNSLYLKLEHSDFWESESQRKLVEKYNVLKEQYEAINQSLQSYYNLPKIAYREYTLRDELSNKELNDNSSSYDV